MTISNYFPIAVFHKIKLEIIRYFYVKEVLYMKKNRKKLLGKRLCSCFISMSFLLSGILNAVNVSASSPASIPETLTLKESAGVCSGNSVAFNVKTKSFNSSKLKFYQDMLDGSHTKTNASAKSGAPNATSSEDWFNIAYMLHRNRQSQSGTSNYTSRMNAMRYSTIAEYNNTGHLYNNEFHDGYVWYIHRSGLNYSNSLNNANTDIRKKLYEYYLAQHTSSSNKKGWDSNHQSATHSFKSLENNTKQDVFWSILSLNRSEGDSRRRGHGSALIAVFYDFKVSPVLQEDIGNTYIRTRSDGSDKNESYVSRITNNSPQNVNAEYTGSTENTVSHTSNINGSSSYTMGHSVTVGTNVNFGAFASGSVDYTFDYSSTVEKGWAKEDSVSKTERKEDKSSISLPAYSAIKMKRTTSDSEEVTTYNCPVILTYKVMLLEHVLNASNDEADAATATLGIFGNSSISAREDLKTYLTDNLNIKDTNRGITWSNFTSNSDTKQAFHYALSNTAQYIPMSSAGATYSVNLKTINISYDGLISTQPLSRIETVNWNTAQNMPAGTSMNISNIKLKGINAAGTDYIGFNQSQGHWILTGADGREDTSSKTASLTTDRTGKVTLNAKTPGSIYLEYVIDENCYATASKPDTFMTNAKLASTAVIKINIGKCKTHKYKNIVTKAAPSKNGKITKLCLVCKDSKFVQTIFKPASYTFTKNVYNKKVLKPIVTITDKNGKKLSADSYQIVYKKPGKNVGTYQAQINFRGNYTGSKTISYQILPKNSTLKSVKALKKSFAINWKQISDKMSSARISGYQIQYSENSKFSKAKTKTVSGYKKTSTTIKKLKSKKKYYVRMRTILKTGGKTYHSKWSASKSIKTK